MEGEDLAVDNFPLASQNTGQAAVKHMGQLLPDPGTVMNEIVPGVFLGLYHGTSPGGPKLLKAAGITHIICAQDLAVHRLTSIQQWKDFTYLLVELNRHKRQFGENVTPIYRSELGNIINTVLTFIQVCLASGGKVLIVGIRGQQAIGVVMIGFLMKRFNISFLDAHNLLWEKGRTIMISADQAAELCDLQRGYVFQEAVMELEARRGTSGTKRKAPLENSGDEDMEVDSSDNTSPEEPYSQEGRNVRPRLDIEQQ